jgi:hypothetical protein
VVELELPLLLSASGLAVILVGWYNRANDEWQPLIPWLAALAVMQVALGLAAWFVLNA